MVQLSVNHNGDGVPSKPAMPFQLRRGMLHVHVAGEQFPQAVLVWLADARRKEKAHQLRCALKENMRRFVMRSPNIVCPRPNAVNDHV
jgi:hypothetical protein